MNHHILHVPVSQYSSQIPFKLQLMDMSSAFFVTVRAGTAYRKI